MTAAGELTQKSVREILPPGRGRERGAVFRDFTSRLRGYVAPPPPDELTWQAGAGAGMILGSAALIALLPAGHAIREAGLLKWVGRSGLASTIDSLSTLAAPFALIGLIALLGIAAIYLSRRGPTPALVFLTAQAWLGVAALAAAVFGWSYLLVVLVANIVIWALFVAFLVACAITALAVLGLLLDS
jgi:hypothetical protein